MKVCEVCGKERIHKQADIPIIGRKDFNTWLYKCTCPQFMLDEITFIRDNNLNISRDQQIELMSLKRQKRDIYDEKKMSYDDYKHWDLMLKSDIQYKENKDGEKIGKEMNACYNPEAKKIQNDIWAMLYRIGRDQGKIDNV